MRVDVGFGFIAGRGWERGRRLERVLVVYVGSVAGAGEAVGSGSAKRIVLVGVGEAGTTLRGAAGGGGEGGGGQGEKEGASTLRSGASVVRAGGRSGGVVGAWVAGSEGGNEGGTMPVRIVVRLRRAST